MRGMTCTTRALLRLANHGMRTPILTSGASRAPAAAAATISSPITRPVNRPCRRCFSQSTPTQKSKGKVHKAGAKEVTAEVTEQGPGKKPKADAGDPYSFDDIEAQWHKIDAFHEDRLKKLRSEGRFNPDVIGEVPVQTGPKGGGGIKVPLRDLAMVVHKGGRTIELRLYQAESKKAVKSAIQAHPDFNQQPQDDAEDEYVLYLRVEPEPAGERVRRVRDACNDWRDQIRQASNRRGKAHRQWRQDGDILPDDLRSLDKELQKRQDKKMAVVEAREKQTLQSIRTVGDS